MAVCSSVVVALPSTLSTRKMSHCSRYAARARIREYAIIAGV